MFAMTCLGVGFNSATMANEKSKHNLNKNLNQANSRNLTVLSYHEVVDAKNALISHYAVTVDQFEKHLDWLQKNGYQFVSVDQVLAAQEGNFALSEKSVLLTFDDGYQSFFHVVYPILQQRKIPVLLSVVGSWLAQKSEQKVQFGDTEVAREQILSLQQLKIMQESGLVEVGNHSYDLHHGIFGNPQGNKQPAAVTRLYQASTQKYESDPEYLQRIEYDFLKTNQLFKNNGIKAPRVMVWPYGRYNQQIVKLAQQAGMPLSLSLDDISTQKNKPVGQLSRILIQSDTGTEQLKAEIESRQKNWTDQHRPQKIMHVDLDYIYDSNPIQQERNLSLLLDRIEAMNINTIYLQAFSDPDGNGSADLVYFPNRYIPMRADLFNRVSWQIQTRTQVSRVYAWMPVYAWELPKSNPVSKHIVVTQQAMPQANNGKHLNMGYHRLSPYSKSAQNVIKGIYQDLAKSSSFNGVIFHDDATLSDYEDASVDALKAYHQIGLPTSLAEIRADEEYLQRWTAFKTQTIDDFTLELANEVRYYQPFLMTARNVYAQVGLSAYAENWYAQSLERSLENYDFTAIMAMPYMEQVDNKEKFFKDLVSRVVKFPNGLKKTVFEIQAVDWRNNQKVSSTEMASTFKSLYEQGVLHVGYYPDNPFEDHPNPKILKAVFDTQSSDLVP